MGLFDFARDIGKKLFSHDAPKEDAAAKIRSEVESGSLGINNLAVDYDPTTGKCVLAGDCPDPAAMQKAVLLAGNIHGVGNVDGAGLNVAAAREEKVEYYLIKSGDSLSKIAKQYYGDASKYPRIFDANREVIKNADLIFPGQKIRIPMD
jgi:nucleoid-associated protein YgaU